jgi:hypothetical protein
MNISEFIEEHRTQLQGAIMGALNWVSKEASCYCPLSGTNHAHSKAPVPDDDEIENWILNDENLYRWARCEGVDI